MVGTATAWQVIQAIGFAPGLLFSGAWLLLAKPWRWRTEGSRDYGALVLVLFLVYAWLEWRIGVRLMVGGPAPLPSPLDQWVSVGFILALDLTMAARFRRFLRLAREERERPVKLCPTCKGRAVVPLEES